MAIALPYRELRKVLDGPTRPTRIGLTQLSAPAGEPVTLTELKSFLRIADTVDDTMLGALLTAARQYAETFTHRAFISQQWRLVLDRVPMKDRIELPFGQLQTIDLVTSFDQSNAGTVFSSTNYQADTVVEPGRLVLNVGSVWPTGALRYFNALQIDFTVGYGDATKVPEELKLAIKRIVATTYEHRDDVPEMMGGRVVANVKVPVDAEALLTQYRLLRI